MKWSAKVQWRDDKPWWLSDIISGQYSYRVNGVGNFKINVGETEKVWDIIPSAKVSLYYDGHAAFKGHIMRVTPSKTGYTLQGPDRLGYLNQRQEDYASSVIVAANMTNAGATKTNYYEDNIDDFITKVFKTFTGDIKTDTEFDVDSLNTPNNPLLLRYERKGIADMLLDAGRIAEFDSNNPGGAFFILPNDKVVLEAPSSGGIFEAHESLRLQEPTFAINDLVNDVTVIGKTKLFPDDGDLFTEAYVDSSGAGATFEGGEWRWQEMSAGGGAINDATWSVGTNGGASIPVGSGAVWVDTDALGGAGGYVYPALQMFDGATWGSVNMTNFYKLKFNIAMLEPSGGASVEGSVGVLLLDTVGIADRIEARFPGGAELDVATQLPNMEDVMFTSIETPPYRGNDSDGRGFWTAIGAGADITAIREIVIKVEFPGGSGVHQIGFDGLYWSESHEASSQDYTSAETYQLVRKKVTDSANWRYATLKDRADTLIKQFANPHIITQGTMSFFDPSIRLNQLVMVEHLGAELYLPIRSYSVNFTRGGESTSVYIGQEAINWDNYLSMFEYNEVVETDGLSIPTYETAYAKCGWDITELACASSCLLSGSLCQTHKEILDGEGADPDRCIGTCQSIKQKMISCRTSCQTCALGGSFV